MAFGLKSPIYPNGASPFDSISLFPSLISSDSVKSRSSRLMAVDAISRPDMSVQHPFSLGSISERKASDFPTTSLLSLGRLDTSPSITAMENLPSILIRGLPKSTNLEVVQTMLLFSKDLSNVNLIDSPKDDKNQITAIARFLSMSGANEAIERLDGKAIGDSSQLVVELHTLPGGRRNTVDVVSNNRHLNGAGSAYGTNGIRHSSRYNNTFQNMERNSPPSDILSAIEPSNSFHNLFSSQLPTSPLGNQNLSKSIINDDPTDETGRLLSDAVAFNDSGDNSSAHSRRLNSAQPLSSRFAGLSLSTSNSHSSGLISPPSLSGFTSPRTVGPAQSPNPTLSPTGMPTLPGLGPNSAYPMPHQHFHRPNYPPVNPADQNPPCNTLYVGNLPMDTSEDELKTIFSKQRGYKRLCFRTKSNGPMCFVEFEDTSFATKALNELYGQPLHNSVKGGIRLSFSKNPLGVRSGQSTGSHSSMSNHGHMNGAGSHANLPGFTTATGPPPGLSVPPGFGNSHSNGTSPGHGNHLSNGYSNHGNHISPGNQGHHQNHGNHGLGLYNNSNGYAMNENGFNSMMRQPIQNGAPTSSSMNGNGGYPSMNMYPGYLSR